MAFSSDQGQLVLLMESEGQNPRCCMSSNPQENACPKTTLGTVAPSESTHVLRGSKLLSPWGCLLTCCDRECVPHGKSTACHWLSTFLMHTLNPTTNPMKSFPNGCYLFISQNCKCFNSQTRASTTHLPLARVYPHTSKIQLHLQHSVCEFTAAAQQAWKCSTLILLGSNQNREHFHFSAAGVILPNRNQNGHLSGHSFSKSHSDKSPRV